jgi:hypothetical protein
MEMCDAKESNAPNILPMEISKSRPGEAGDCEEEYET